jgi:hypothetical protein
MTTSFTKLAALFVIFSTGLLSSCAEIKEAGRTIGHTTRNVTREIGHGTRRVVNSIGQEASNGTEPASDEQ